MKRYISLLVIAGCMIVNACKKQVAPVTPALQVQKYDFTWTDARATDTVVFHANASGAKHVRWDFGDGTVLNYDFGALIVDHVFKKGGTYTVTLVVDSAEDEKVSKDVVIKEQTYYSYDGIKCVGEAIAFTTDNPGADKYLWDFGDGTTSSEAAPKHVYTKNGIFHISLKMNDDYYARGVDSIQIYRRPEYTDLIVKSWDWDLSYTSFYFQYQTGDTSAWSATFPVEYVNPLRLGVNIIDSNGHIFKGAYFDYYEPWSNQNVSVYTNEFGEQLTYNAMKNSIRISLGKSFMQPANVYISFVGTTK